MSSLLSTTARYDRAAQSGSSQAIHALGVIAADPGLPSRYDPRAAFDHFKRAAEKGVRESMHALAVMYACGVGCARNYALALEWMGMICLSRLY